MATTYVPILRWKQGERIALRNLSGAGRFAVVPHIEVAESQYGAVRKSKKPPKKPPSPAPDALAKLLGDAWGGAKLFIDASDLPGNSTSHTLDDLRASGSVLGLHLVPSIKLTSPSDYLSAVKRANASDGRGAALRISLAQATAAPSWVGQWPCPLSETDLIIDLGGSVGTVLALGQTVHDTFKALHNGGNWRSVTIAGGNIPATLTGYVVGLTNLTHAELQLWNNLRNSGLPYDLQYGDYTTIGPDSSTEGIGGPVPINAKYTLLSEFAVFHGVKNKGPKSKPRDQQYRAYAKHIVNYPTRNSLPHCWGDSMIDAIDASPTSAPGSPASWVSYSVNRHIELTRFQLP